MKAKTKKSKAVSSEAAGAAPLHTAVGGTSDATGAGPGSKHREVIRRMFVVRKEFWSEPEALARFDAIVADIRKRIVKQQEMQKFDSIVYQWCQVNGQQYWCACVTEIVGGVLTLVCNPV